MAGVEFYGGRRLTIWITRDSFQDMIKTAKKIPAVATEKTFVRQVTRWMERLLLTTNKIEGNVEDEHEDHGTNEAKTNTDAYVDNLRMRISRSRFIIDQAYPGHGSLRKKWVSTTIDKEAHSPKKTNPINPIVGRKKRYPNTAK